MLRLSTMVNLVSVFRVKICNWCHHQIGRENLVNMGATGWCVFIDAVFEDDVRVYNPTHIALKVYDM